MILSTEQQAHIEQAIKQKYGNDAVRNPADSIDRIRRKEITSEYIESCRKWEEYEEKEEITEEGSVVIIDRKANKGEPKRICKDCGKENLVFTNRDYFYASKHGCCENCYYQLHQ